MQTQLKQMQGVGRAVQYIVGRYNSTSYTNLYKYIPLVFRGNYHKQSLEDFCVVFVSFVGPTQAEGEIHLIEASKSLNAEA